MRLTKLLILLSTTLLISSCGTFGKTEVVTTVPEVIKTKIPVVERPKPLQLTKMKFYVVNDENYEQFKQEFIDKNGTLVYIAISIKDYENLSLNIADMKRYIDQQKEIIVYYETAVNPPEDNPEESTVETNSDE